MKHNTKFRIAMIGQKRVPSRDGGVEIVVWELAKRLRDLGYEVDCYNRYNKSVKPSEEYERIPGRHGWYKDGIRIITVPTFKNGKLNAIVYSFLATVRALFGNYDVIHFHAEGPCLMIPIAKFFGKRCIATIHGLDWQRAKWGNFASKMLQKGERTAALHADEVIVLSKNVQDYFKDKYHRDTHFIPNGIAKPQKAEPNEITTKFGLDGDDYILTLSRIVPEKGIHYLLHAFKNIDTDKKLVIAGGASNAAEYMEEIKTLAAQDSRVVLTDFIHDRTLQEICSNAYVYCLPSDIEGMSISLLEMMSYGTCCLVSDIDENMEVVEEMAVSFSKGNESDLQDKLTYLIRNPEIVAEYRKKSSGFICSKYNWDDVVRDTIKLYR
ncbi:glycosyltransferase family 4 protein [Butyrivibrio fibrisolvens]|uniref:glycosyltransferase family 4 protein n=1 Tax=Butyrivibrio fibrisolvens TaxID=831 RepID=UPI000424B1B7|nr:glycosyltransferase family 4 protein [Butyrivibrio fibrisolvens]